MALLDLDPSHDIRLEEAKTTLSATDDASDHGLRRASSRTLLWISSRSIPAIFATYCV